VVAIVMDSIPIVGNITCSHGGRCDLRCRSDRDWVVLEIDTSWGGWAGPRSALVPRCDPLEMALAPRHPSSSSRAGGHPSTRVPDDVPYLPALVVIPPLGYPMMYHIYYCCIFSFFLVRDWACISIAIVRWLARHRHRLRQPRLLHLL
jgi:hypothetical protein